MGYLKDNIVGYISRNKKWVIFLAVCLIVIFLSSMIASGIQSDGWQRRNKCGYDHGHFL